MMSSRQNITAEWLSDLAGRILDLAGEAELRFGDLGPCQYPSEVAHNAAYRKANEMKDAAVDIEGLAADA